MGNQLVFKRKKHTYTNALGHTHYLTYVVYEEMVERTGALDIMDKPAVVEIKGYRVVINETVEHNGEYAYTRNYDLGFLSTRTSEINYLLARLPRCKGIEEVHELVEDLKVDFRVAIERDIRKALKKLLGLRTHNLTNNMVPSRSKEPTPLKIPYRKTNKRK
jgi:hypothetical protein